MSTTTLLYRIEGYNPGNSVTMDQRPIPEVVTAKMRLVATEEVLDSWLAFRKLDTDYFAYIDPNPAPPDADESGVEKLLQAIKDFTKVARGVV